MKPNSLFVETLEPRVAPAVLVNGGNLLGGKNNPSAGEISNGSNTITLVEVTKGEALVFYDAVNRTITSISAGDHAVLDLNGPILGDIVTNLTKNGRLTDSDGDPSNGEDGGILLPSNIDGITTHDLNPLQIGSVGRIIAGGTVSNVNVSGNLHGIYTGDGIFRSVANPQISTFGVDYNTIALGSQTTFDLRQDLARYGAKTDISDVKVAIGAGLEVFAGNGGPDAEGKGGAGGSINRVDVVKSFSATGSAPAINLHSGDGGDGAVGGKAGSISGFTDEGSNTQVHIETGHGGAGANGAGGAGGSFVKSSITTSSPSYEFILGKGGDGATAGGRGGSIKGLAYNATVTAGASLIAGGDFDNDGAPDVLVINGGTGDAVLSLQGSGSNAVTQADGSPFIAPQGISPSDVAVADFNADGLLDFSVSYASSNTIGVFYNQGGGVFTGTQVSVPTSPFRLVAGDFTGTAAVDLAYVSKPEAANGSNAVVSLVYAVTNTGDRTFAVSSSPNSISGTASDMVSVRINGDTRPDLFISAQGGGAGSINVLLATGGASDGGFRALTPIATNLSNVSNLDALPATATSGVKLLAFAAATDGDDTTPGNPTALQIYTINGAGVSDSLATQTVTGGSQALFVSADGDYAVLDGSSVTVTYNTARASVTGITYTAANTTLTAFTSLGNDAVAVLGATASRFFLNSGNNLLAVDLPTLGQSVSLAGGAGGHGGSGAGGSGGAIKTVTFTEALDGPVDQAGGAYSFLFNAGAGGGSDGGVGGAGGALTKLTVNVDPANSTLGNDDTTFLGIAAGAGGGGAVGGAGGSISKLTAGATYDQISNGAATLNSFTARLAGGVGGAGTQGAGGAGGSITLNGNVSLVGVSFYDVDSSQFGQPALAVLGGDGGQGATVGGAGGALINVGTQNASVNNVTFDRNELFGARLLAGAGGAGGSGNGGRGGDLTSADISVFDSVVSAAGRGGNSDGGVGGAGGALSKSHLASTSGNIFSDGFGVLATAGDGGDGGAGGGKGGGVVKLQLNSPSDPSLYAAVIKAGDGGAALGGGNGGNGGAVKGVTQTKDVNSSINAILAGNGGAGGGKGGSIKKIDTAGFIGLPSSPVETLGAFNSTPDAPLISALFPDGLVSQGIFAGEGEGGNGSVKSVNARQVAAIAAAPRGDGTFAVAAAVQKVTADLIGYEVYPAGGQADNVFQSNDGSGASPSGAKPLEGFILAAAVSEINTVNNARTAEFTFLG